LHEVDARSKEEKLEKFYSHEVQEKSISKLKRNSSF